MNNARTFPRQRAKQGAVYHPTFKGRAEVTRQANAGSDHSHSRRNVSGASSPCNSITATKKHFTIASRPGFYSSVMIDASGEPFEKNVEIISGS